MNLYKNLIIDILGNRQSGHFVKRSYDIESLQVGASVAMFHTNDKIGDAVIQSAFLLGLRESRLRAHQVVVTTPRFEDYWRSHPGVDEVIPIPNRVIDNTLRSFVGHTRFLKQNRRRFDVTVSFDQFCRVGTFYRVAALDSKINVGFSKEMFPLFGYSIPKNLDGSSYRTPAERTRDLLRLFGVQTDERVYPVHVPVGKSDLAIEGTRPRIFINACANLKRRTFSASTLRHICEIVRQRFPQVRLFLSVSHDFDEEGIGDMREDPMVTLVKPCKTYFELFDMVDQMDAVITPDTGIAHIAAGLNKPLFTVFTNNYYLSQSWRPMSNNLEWVSSPSEQSVNDLDWSQMEAGISQLLRHCLDGCLV